MNTANKGARRVCVREICQHMLGSGSQVAGQTARANALLGDSRPAGGNLGTERAEVNGLGV